MPLSQKNTDTDNFSSYQCILLYLNLFKTLRYDSKYVDQPNKFSKKFNSKHPFL